MSTANAWRSTSYTDEKLGFSFQYPIDWQAISNNESGSEWSLSIKNSNTTAAGTIRLYYYDKPRSQSLELFSKEKEENVISGDPLGIWYASDEVVTNKNNLVGYYDKDHYCVSKCQRYSWVNNTQDKVFMLVNNAWNDGRNDVPKQTTVFKNIFNTFKFLDQTKDTKNWKTYKNDYFLFSYPSGLAIKDTKNPNSTTELADITLTKFKPS